MNMFTILTTYSKLDCTCLYYLPPYSRISNPVKITYIDSTVMTSFSISLQSLLYLELHVSAKSLKLQGSVWRLFRDFPVYCPAILPTFIAWRRVKQIDIILVLCLVSHALCLHKTSICSYEVLRDSVVNMLSIFPRGGLYLFPHLVSVFCDMTAVIPSRCCTFQSLIQYKQQSWRMHMASQTWQKKSCKV